MGLFGLQNNNYDLLLFCNPNNPTGQFIKLEDIKKAVNILYVVSLIATISFIMVSIIIVLLG